MIHLHMLLYILGWTLFFLKVSLLQPLSLQFILAIVLVVTRHYDVSKI